MRRYSNRQLKHRSCNARTNLAKGFTLIELLVVMTIIIVLLTMTALAVNFTREGERVRGAARQVQSFLAGARDRAIYAKEPRGVRFFVTPENNRAVTTMAYIAPGGTWGSPENSAGISLERVDGNSDGDFDDAVDQVVRVHGTQNPGWWNLKRRGWLIDGLRIRIPKGPTGNWYPIDTTPIDTTVAPPNNQYLLLQVPYADAGNKGQEVAHLNLTYEIELPARLLPQDPSILPESVVIDLDGSKVPDGWRPQNSGNGEQYSGFMDIVFSPRGNIVGDSAGAGLIHLYVSDSEDSLFLKERFEAQVAANGDPRPAFNAQTPFVPMDELLPTSWVGGDRNYLAKERRLISVFTQTGAVSVHEANAFVVGSGLLGDNWDRFDIDNDGNYAEADGLADAPYFFAETGKAAK